MKRTLLKPGRTPEEKKLAVVAMYMAIHGRKPPPEQIKAIEARLAGEPEQDDASENSDA